MTNHSPLSLTSLFKTGTPAIRRAFLFFCVGCTQTYNKAPVSSMGKGEGIHMWETSGQTQQLHRLLQLFAAQLEPARAMEVAWVYPEFTPGTVYQTGDYLRRGYNAVGDPQLYQVTLDHRASAGAVPEHTPELYEPVGLDGGVPLWSRPAGDRDGYTVGDVVCFRGSRYRCLAEICLLSPEDAPEQWQALACKNAEEPPVH